jgi:hypothetical protein
MRGRWEGLPVGKFLEQVSKFRFFAVFPQCAGFKILDFFAVSCNF